MNRFPISLRRVFAATILASATVAALEPNASAEPRYFNLPSGTGVHDVAPAPAPGGPVYFTAQRSGQLGVLTPSDGKVALIDLGKGSAPHGVIIGPDGAPWLTDGGRNAIVRVDPDSHAVKAWPLPEEASNANLNTAAFDAKGRLWFTGQSGYFGRLNPASGKIDVWKSPRGSGPYGIAATPSGDIYFASLGGNYLARVDPTSGTTTVIDPPTARQGARRVWADSKGRLWVSYWNAGEVGRYDPGTGSWREWALPGAAHAYGVYVDDRDRVWLSDWGSNAILRFDPDSGKFEPFPSDRSRAGVRQLNGRRGEIWGAESGNDRLVMIAVP